MKKFHLLWLSAYAFGSAVIAAEPPVTGGALQQLPPATAVPPAQFPQLEIRRPDSAVPVKSEADGIKIIVQSVRITGGGAFAADELVRVAAFVPNSAYSLLELHSMAARIESYYQQQGYPVAQAYLPAQDIKDGVVILTVAEGHYGQIKVRNQTNVGAALIAELIDGIADGEMVRSEPLDEQLVRLGELPGVRIRAALVPGATFGSSDLLLDVLPGKRVDGSVDIDNAGNRYSGAVRIGASINLNEPTGQGDVASLRLLSSGKGLNYFRGAYQMQVGKARLGAAYSSLDYALGKEFDSLLANGTAQVASFYASYPLLRSRDLRLYGGLTFDRKRFQDRTDSVGAFTDKSSNVMTMSLTADQRDRFAGGGRNSVALNLSSGEVSILTQAARLIDASTAHSNGHFNKLAFNASRVQELNGPLSLYASVSGQVGSKNLDISEKMELGGMYGVRAYPEGESYGDGGYVLSVEARLLVSWLAARAPGRMQVLGFIDQGHIKLNTHPWTSEPNSRTLSAVGIGLSWEDARDFTLRLIVARKQGGEPARSAPDSSYRLWLQAVKYF